MRIADAVKYVLANRKNKVCKDWTPFQITHSISMALENRTLAYTTDTHGNLNGIVWGKPDFEKKVLHIETILATCKSTLPKLMRHFLDIYDGWTLTADRRGKFVKYSTERLRKTYGS